MKKIFCSLVAISISFLTFSQGFIWNEEIKQKQKSFIEEIVTLTRSVYPSSYSLERYAPYVHHQAETGMCVAYALANCRTIIYAKNKRITDKEDINLISFSPFFSYYHSKEDNDAKCQFGLDPIDALISLRDEGIAQLYDVEYPDYWPFTNKQLCTYYPPTYRTDKNNAKNYKIDEPRYVSDDLSISKKIVALKSEISSGNPIFFAMDPFPSSLWASNGYKLWTPEQSVQCMGVTQSGDQCTRKVKYSAYCYQHKNNEESSMGHAMVIIAYDDNMYGGAFQILNSYGEEWGDNGKIWIMYNDLITHSLAFFPISRKSESSNLGRSSPELISSEKDSMENLTSPSFIKTELDPPWSKSLKKE